MLSYEEYMASKEEDFEGTCLRCGACCGAFDDPCAELEKNGQGHYFCRSYKERFGQKTTVSGKTFNCVSIREHIRAGTLREGCGYADMLKNIL
ncbi:MAG: hypothetical protein PHW14_00660 [Candidatus Omnitrophica bacterium]|nr:hypothetical protein [Candidatus Omnitrophota bacterium]